MHSVSAAIFETVQCKKNNKKINKCNYVNLFLSLVVATAMSSCFPEWNMLKLNRDLDFRWTFLSGILRIGLAILKVGADTWIDKQRQCQTSH